MIKASEFCDNVFDGTHDTPRPVEKGYKLLTSKHIMNGFLDKENAYYISEEDYNFVNQRSKVHKWDILFSMIGTVGNVYLVKEDNIDFAIKNMGVFSCKEEYKAKWLYFYLQSPYAKSVIKNYLNGAVQKFLALGMLRNFPVPEMKEQDKKTVDLLWKITQKIENNNKVNAELETMAKMIYDYWFLQFEFPNEDGKPYKSSGGRMVWNEELKREIPEGWRISELGKVIETNRGISYNSKTIEGRGIPMINLASFSPDGSYKESGLKVYSGKYSEDKVIKPYTLVMCNTQQTAIDFSKDIIGKALLVPDIFGGQDIVTSHHVNTINTNNDNLKFFLYRLFNTEYFHKYATGYANGTNILGLIFSGIEKYVTEIPDDNTLNKFASIMQKNEIKKSQIIKENQELTSLREFLLPLLMSGQVEFVKNEDAI